MGVWENLPKDLLKKIEEQYLIFLIDKIRMSYVCKSWQSSITPNIPNKRRFQLPFLLAPTDHGICQISHELFDMFEKKTYYLDLPAAQGKQFRGSSYGWVATVEDTPSMYLINPFTGVKIDLPPRNTFPDVKQYRNSKRHGKQYIMSNGSENENMYWPAIHVRDHFLRKIILSCSPHLKDDYIAVAIYGSNSDGLAYCKHGDKRWTPIPLPFCSEIHDIIFYKGLLYAISCVGTLFIIETGPSPKVIETKKVPAKNCDQCKYLIESSIGLLMVSRDTFHVESSHSIACDVSLDDESAEPYETTALEVFMFDSSSCSWQRLTSIGDNVLFLGHNYSLSLSSHEFPGARNKVYFTDNIDLFYKNEMIGGYNIAVFDFESGTIESLSGFNCDPRFIFPVPVWIIPNGS